MATVITQGTPECDLPDRAQALDTIEAFCGDGGEREDRFNRALLDARMRPLFVDPHGAPGACSFHLDPSPVCFARRTAGGPWRATRCDRMPMAARDDRCSNQHEGDAGNHVHTDADAGESTPDGDYEAFCKAACASMRHPAFTLLWRHGSSRRGTILEGVPHDATLMAHDKTFVTTVHRACLALVPHAVGDAAIADLVRRAGIEVGHRLATAIMPDDLPPPSTCCYCGGWRKAHLSVLCMRRENAVVVAFCEALVRWRTGDGDGSHDQEASVAWAANAVSTQDAMAALLAEERARCRERARAALHPIDSVCYVYVNNRQFFRGDDDGQWTCERRARGTDGILRWAPVRRTRDAYGAPLPEPILRVYDDAHVEHFFAAHIAGAPEGHNVASVRFRDGTLRHMETRLDASPLVAMAVDASQSWSIGPGVLATEMAVYATAAAIASRPGHAERLGPIAAALSLAQRAIDALYADETTRRLVIEAAIVDGADRAMAATPLHFQMTGADREGDANNDHGSDAPSADTDGPDRPVRWTGFTRGRAIGVGVAAAAAAVAAAAFVFC
ncbi:hypothetical protein pdul_cds_134 [Pandoravirus dulcis]|uniref:Uncharacterized protein n=1 Tax=Pandoravirus dulcis TaxID=1349409 RepID=S4VVE1_9VIRU|nr:hypothetical protein pdul_cds_134 [Pandoravirus dulcis]AGO82051.1 hypothetical protein pdul_cds_134 [Pandoravirus dulcis]